MQNMLITGGDHEDRVNYATQLALCLLCEHLSMTEACKKCANCSRVLRRCHPNLIVIEPTSTKDDGGKTNNGSIKIDQIRELVIEGSKANFENGVSVFIISHMHRATKSAANALLKVMEESKDNKVIIALAPSRTSVLATIASRLVVYQVKPHLDRYFSSNTDMQRKIFMITNASTSTRFSFCEHFSADRDLLLTELHELALECHVMLRNKAVSPLFALKLREALERAISNLGINLNPRLVTERLILREWPSIAK